MASGCHPAEGSREGWTEPARRAGSWGWSEQCPVVFLQVFAALLELWKEKFFLLFLVFMPHKSLFAAESG